MTPSRSRSEEEVRKVSVIGVPLDLGADRRGVDMGPSAIRYAGLNRTIGAMGIDVEDLGNVSVPTPESRKANAKNAKYALEIIQACEELAGMVEDALKRERTAVVLGGDHSLAMGSIVGASRVHSDLGLIWFDAHGDFNTPSSSPSGNVHGMPFAALFNHGTPAMKSFCKAANLAPSRCVLVGLREADEDEKVLLRNSGIRVFTMEAIDRYGMRSVMEQAIAIASGGAGPFHVSFDVDAMDPAAAPGVGTPVIGGINYRESLMALEMIAEKPGLTSVDMVEVNPILDHGNVTAWVVVNLAAAILGRRIL